MTEEKAVKIIEELIDGYLDTYYSIMKNENECYKDFAMEFLEYVQALKLILGNYAEALYRIAQIEGKENNRYTKESENILLIAGYIRGLLGWYKGEEKTMDIEYAKHILQMNIDINTKYKDEESEDENYNQLISLANTCILNELDKKDKIIHKMAEYLAQVRECVCEDFEVDLNCDKRCDGTDETLVECWKMYFERKIKENAN